MKLVWNKLEFWKRDLVKRALWTFGQSFLGVFLAGAAVNITQVQLKALVVASIAAGLSALKGLFIAYKPSN